MKIPKISMQDVIKSATDTSVISFRVNGRNWTFFQNGSFTCFDCLNLKSIYPSELWDSVSIIELLLFDFETLQSVLPFEK